MKQGHEPLQWNDSLATGIENIDKQHKLLINILNDANHCFRENGSCELQEKVIEDLLAYTIYHFNTEEELMENRGYGEKRPEEELAHTREHRAFTGKINGYRSAIRRGEGLDHEKVFSFLNGWLIEHVMETDKRLGRFLSLP